MNNIFYVNRLGQMNLSELESVFEMVGAVKSIRSEVLAQSTLGTRFGVIEMENEQQAADCIERYNGQEVLGQILSVSAAIPIYLPRIVEAQKGGRRKGAR